MKAFCWAFLFSNSTTLHELMLSDDFREVLNGCEAWLSTTIAPLTFPVVFSTYFVILYFLNFYLSAQISSLTHCFLVSRAASRHSFFKVSVLSDSSLYLIMKFIYVIDYSPLLVSHHCCIPEIAWKSQVSLIRSCRVISWPCVSYLSKAFHLTLLLEINLPYWLGSSLTSSVVDTVHFAFFFYFIFLKFLK